MNADSAASHVARSGPTLAVIVPTFNERGNVVALVDALACALRGVRWEVIFVDDDSPDGTASTAFELSRSDARVRCVQRLGRRGLSSACVEGMLATSAPYLAVIDGDMQHDESRLPIMLQALEADATLDLVIGSRYVAAGGVGDWDPVRARISRFATRLGRSFVPETLGDPMSGFFMIRREIFFSVARNLSNIGFKILLDIFASAPQRLRFAEVPYTFRSRKVGQSKLDSQASWDYLMLLLDKAAGGYVPVRFLAFSIVGAFGIAVHFAILMTLMSLSIKDFTTAQAIATFGAMTFNYAVNNALTYRDQRLRGLRWLRGWFTFVLGCSIGALANVGIATWMFEHQYRWVLAAVAGILVGSVWNYAITMAYTWGKPRKAS